MRGLSCSLDAQRGNALNNGIFSPDNDRILSSGSTENSLVEDDEPERGAGLPGPIQHGGEQLLVVPLVEPKKKAHERLADALLHCVHC